MVWVGSLAAFLAYLAKGLAGFGSTVVFTSTLSFFAVNRNITPVDLILSIPSNIAIVWSERKGIRYKTAFTLIAMLLVGMVPGTLFLKLGEDRLIKLILGVCIIGLSVEMFLRFRSTKVRKSNPVALLIIGVASGFLCGLFGIGAFLVAYVGRTTENQSQLRGTLCFVFLADNLLRTILYLATGLLTMEVLHTVLLLTPAMAAGLALGMVLAKRVPQKITQNITVGMLLLMGISVVVANLR